MSELIIREAAAADAEAMIEYLKAIGGESDNLTFGAEGLPITAESERDYLESVLADKRSTELVAVLGGEIIGDASLTALPRRMSHRAELGIAVRKAYWGRGVGSMLMEELIAFAEESGTEIIDLEVRSDNSAAIHLYEKYGFVRFGRSPAYFRIDGEYIDFDLMYLDLRKP